MTFSGRVRGKMLQEMSETALDLLVIGGGITGAGIALDAVTRGMRTGLVEMQDFAAGTSSRSTKLVHGGLRYLKQLEFKMVAEVGRERAVVYENGPHVTTPEWMLLPIYRGGTFGKLGTYAGLTLYDYLAGVRKSERKTMLSAEDALRREPMLKADDLKGGGVYVEYRTDDARLTIEVLKAAVESGAQAVNYAEATGFLRSSGEVNGVVVMDRLTGQTYHLYAHRIVNAAGPWVDRLRSLNDFGDGSGNGKSLRLTKGVHLVFDSSRFPLSQAVYFDTPDRRMVFAIPREGKTYVGTTDTFYEGDPAHPRVSSQDVTYLLSAVNVMFPAVKLSEEDIESSWAGLRPLILENGKSPSEISRKDEIWQDSSGLISIAGGKLTGYRKMAEAVVDRVAEQLTGQGRGPYGPCVTKQLPISGGNVGGSGEFPRFVQAMSERGIALGLPQEAAQRLAARYGSNAEKVYRCALLEKLAGTEAMPTELYGMLVYAMEEEMAVTPVDFWLRRHGGILFDRKTVERWKQHAFEVMKVHFGWDERQSRTYAEELEQALRDAVVPEGERESG